MSNDEGPGLFFHAAFYWCALGCGVVWYCVGRAVLAAIAYFFGGAS